MQRKDDYNADEFGESGIDHDFVRITYEIVLTLVIAILIKICSCSGIVFILSTEHDKPHFDLFFTTISTSKKMFFFRARAEKGIV